MFNGGNTWAGIISDKYLKIALTRGDRALFLTIQTTGF